MQRLGKYLLLLSLIAVSFSSNAQNRADSANECFVNGRYAEAIPIYRELLDRFSEDPTYNYRLGVAYFLSNTDLKEAYRYLKISSTKDVPVKVYFYLGEVCRYLYRFDESLEYYKRFVVNGGSSDVSSVEVELAAGATANGQKMLKYGANVTPIAKAVVPKADFYKTYDTYSTDAGFGSMPDNLKTGLDIKKKNKSAVFSKKNGGDIGDIVVFVSYGNGETGSKDLYYIQKQPTGQWTAPERLPSTINSPFDEDYPYMCSDNRTLYFASMGLYGVGGYDIYKTTFDAGSKTWSTPENLGYPINSPYDDFLFIPNDKNDEACFASNRGVISTEEVAVFKVAGIGNDLKLTLTPEEALNIQPLEPKSKEINEEKKSVDAVQNEKEEYSGVEKNEEYRNLKRALVRNGILIDSTTRNVERLRVAWSNLPDSMRSSVEKLIVFNEGKIAEYNDLHSNLMIRINSMEKDYLNGKLPENSDREFDGLEWFLTDIIVAPVVTESQKQKIRTSPLNMARATSLVDSISIYDTEIEDLEQMVGALSTEGEREEGTTKLALAKQARANALNLLINEWGVFYKNYYEVMMELTKSMGATIADISLRNRAERDFVSAKGIRSNQHKIDNNEDAYKFLEEAYIAEKKSIDELNLYLAQEANRKELVDSLRIVLNPKVEKDEVVVVDSAARGVYAAFGIVQRENVAFADATLSAPRNDDEFVLNKESIYSKTSTFPSLKSLPGGTVYSIQLGMFSQSLNYHLFKFSPMFADAAGGNGAKKVYAGAFQSYSNAQDGLRIVKSNGFKDAFIVAFFERKPVNVAHARTTEAKNPTKAAAVATEEAPSMYRVVVGTFDGELPVGIKDVVVKLLSDKELIKSVTSSGSVTYSIGNFDNFEDAIPLKNSLVGEGVVEAFVTKIEMNKTAQ